MEKEHFGKVAPIFTPHTIGGAGYTHSFINYRRILKDGLIGYRTRVEALAEGDFKDAMLILLDGIEAFRERCISLLKESNADKALMAIRESGGLVVNVSDEEIMAAQKLLGSTCGVFGEPAGVAGTAGLKKLCDQGKLPADATVVSVVTGNGLKDVANAIRACGEPISIPNDMDLLLKAFVKEGIQPE